MCDTVCLRSADGMWFAKNSDRHPDEVQLVEWHEPRRARSELRTQYLTIPDADASGFLGSRPTWLWGCEHGANAHGVAIGNEKIWTVDRPRDRPPALLGMDIVRLVLERARTADDALTICTTLLEQYGQGGSGEPHADEPYFSSFLLVDAHGGWVLETSDRTWAARPVGAGASISNRVSMTTDWTRSSAAVAAGSSFDVFRHQQMPTAIADHRLTVTRACIASERAPTVARLAATMRDHGPANGGEVPRDVGSDWEGFTVCMHRPEAHAQTTASMIVHLSGADEPLRVWAALGNPCVGVYMPAFPPFVSAELADEQVWTRFAALRAAVEAGATTVAAVRAELDPVERELWAEADEIYTTGDRGRLGRFTRNAFAPVDAALHRLGI